jgi:hypothetical protein
VLAFKEVYQVQVQELEAVMEVQVQTHQDLSESLRKRWMPSID